MAEAAAWKTVPAWPLTATGIPIGPGIAIAGRARPVKQTKSAHTSSAPDHVRSGTNMRRDMRAMLGHPQNRPADHGRAGS